MTDSNIHRANPRFLGELASHGNSRSWFYADMNEIPIDVILSPSFFGDLKRSAQEDTIRAGDVITISCRAGMFQRVVEHAETGRVVFRSLYEDRATPRQKAGPNAALNLNQYEVADIVGHLDTIDSLLRNLLGGDFSTFPPGTSWRAVAAARNATAEIRGKLGPTASATGARQNV